MRLVLIGVFAATGLLAPASALAWGYEGHEVIALIARAYMAPAVLARVDAALASDTGNSLTAHDMASEATWADAWRGAGHRETASWHFIDLELAGADLKSACFGFPQSGTPASGGPANDCIVDKLEAFTRELDDPTTTADERLTALKYVLHFVGDIHQPLHAADNQDHGGNCVNLGLGGPRTQNLHSYWDTAVIEAIGENPTLVARMLIAKITPAEIKTWSSGGPKDWAFESYAVARAKVYTIGSKPGCGANQAPIALPPGYGEIAKATASKQLQKAGVRLAVVLNRAFGP